LNTFSPSKRLQLFLLVLLSLFVGSACAPIRMGVAWGALAQVDVNNTPRVFVAYNNWAILLDPSTGKIASLLDEEGNIRFDEQGNPRRWEVDGNKFETTQFFTRPVLRDNDGVASLLLGAHTNRLIEVDLETARVDNTAGIKLDGPVVADIAENDTTYFVPLENHDVVAIDKTTLAEVWQFATVRGVWAKPLLVDNTLYIVTVDHLLYAVDAATGEALWEEPTDLRGLIGAMPTLYNGALYVGNANKHLFKIDAQSGEILDEFATNGWVWSTPVIVDDVLYVGDLSGYVYALNPNDFSVVWQVQTPDGGIRPSPLVAEQYVIVATRHGKVYWLNRANGSMMIEREIEGRPEVLSDLLLVPANEEAEIYEPLVLVSSLNMTHLVVAYSLEGGNLKWVYGR
jgi:outer membrane protein assembly factor BamB